MVVWATWLQLGEDVSDSSLLLLSEEMGWSQNFRALSSMAATPHTPLLLYLMLESFSSELFPIGSAISLLWRVNLPSAFTSLISSLLHSCSHSHFAPSLPSLV